MTAPAVGDRVRLTSCIGFLEEDGDACTAQVGAVGVVAEVAPANPGGRYYDLAVTFPDMPDPVGVYLDEIEIVDGAA